MKNRNNKWRWVKTTLKAKSVVAVAFIVTCLVFDFFVQFRRSDQQLMGFFKANNIKGEIHYYKSHNRKIRYVSVGKDSLPTLFFIHGSPSSLSIYEGYFKDTAILKSFKLLAVDRPGYGFSGLGNPIASIKKQAAMIRPVLDSLHKVTRPVIVVASSYGTSIACRLAMDYPALVDGLVLVAPSLAPGEEKVFWFSPSIENPLLNWFIPRMFRSANTEKLAHKAELMKMLPYWKNIRVPVVYLQGEKDELVYTTNADFARKHLVNVPFLDIHFFKGRPHFIPFSERPTIKRKIFELFDNIRKGIAASPLKNSPALATAENLQ